MGLRDWVAGKIKDEIAERINTPEKVKAMIENAPKLSGGPPLGWKDWLGHVLLRALLTAGLVAAVHGMADGFGADDLWSVAQAMVAAVPGVLVAATWARGNIFLTLAFGFVTTVATMLGQDLLGHHLDQHDLMVAVENGVAFAANAFLKRPDEESK